ncbi:MAG: transposase [Anaerolineaceae bacterium]|nr:transposase [Anaerolineaceae bacterium]
MGRKYRTFTPDFKLDTVMEGIRGEKSIAQICRERKIKDTQYYKWREMFLKNAADIFDGQNGDPNKELKERIAELEQMIGKLTMENEILKKAKSWLGSTYRNNGS